MKKHTYKHAVIWKSAVDIALEKMNVEAAPMPVSTIRSNYSTRIRTIALILGASFVVLLYVAVPLITALHKYLFPVAQDATLVLSIIIELAIFMIFIIMKTDGR